MYGVTDDSSPGLFTFADCISGTKVLKCIEGQFNKVLILTMDDGDEVVAKLPNPNAGPPFYTLSSKVATRHFVSDGVIDASCKYTLFTDGILLTWNTAPIYT